MCRIKAGLEEAPILLDWTGDSEEGNSRPFSHTGGKEGASEQAAELLLIIPET